MAEHVITHAPEERCLEYTMQDGSVKGICRISPQEASELLRHYVEIEVGKEDTPWSDEFEKQGILTRDKASYPPKEGPLTQGFGGPVIGSYTMKETPEGVVVYGTLNGPIEINAPHNMSISTD